MVYSQLSDCPGKTETFKDHPSPCECFGRLNNVSILVRTVSSYIVQLLCNDEKCACLVVVCMEVGLYPVT